MYYAVPNRTVLSSSLTCAAAASFLNLSIPFTSVRLNEASSSAITLWILSRDDTSSGYTSPKILRGAGDGVSRQYDQGLAGIPTKTQLSDTHSLLACVPACQRLWQPHNTSNHQQHPTTHNPRAPLSPGSLDHHIHQLGKEALLATQHLPPIAHSTAQHTAQHVVTALIARLGTICGP